ncbi:MAG: ABC transporter ATP-binding protein [Coriobacteriaceae bacterium]|nr:ABC transporter ATP-binding protein [Coriobacteriaceae bacterium]
MPLQDIAAPKASSFAIEATKLTKRYGKARGIDDVDLCVEQGDIFGFIGPNGAGKSTFIRTLLGLISPTGGSAHILGLDCARQTKEILGQVGYMPSEAMFYQGMKVGDILALSARLRKQDCVQEAALLCNHLDLDPGRKVEELSMGNRRKVGIVCALQHRPSVYILDEPTSGLDPLVQREFFGLLMARHEQGATILLSSHVLSEVQRYCKHAAIIREGRVIASGTVDELSSGSARRVRIQGLAEPPALAGIRNPAAHAGGVDFFYQGDMRALVAALAKEDFADLIIEEPDIEEVFMHYYEADGAGGPSVQAATPATSDGHFGHATPAGHSRQEATL